MSSTWERILFALHGVFLAAFSFSAAAAAAVVSSINDVAVRHLQSHRRRRWIAGLSAI
jgi:hypothetical protein